MKKFLPLIALLLLGVFQISAQTGALLFNENFSNLANGDLKSPNGNWINTDNNGPYVQIDNSAPLIYPNYTSGTQYATTSQVSNSDDPYKAFLTNATIQSNNNTVIYMSFVVRANDFNNVPNANDNATQLLSLRITSGGSDYLKFYLGDRLSGPRNNRTHHLQFGISKTNNSNPSWISNNYNYGDVYLILIKYVFSSSSSDRMYIWVNPDISSEPSTQSADLSINSGQDIATGLSLVKITQDNDGAAADFDGIKVAYANGATGQGALAANSALAWDILGAFGAPLPVKFGTIKATPAGSSVKVDWQTYNEVNVDHYEVERSADGVHFSTVGSVAANNVTQLSNYSLTDASPLGGNSFYRVKNVDIDGKFSYSVIVKVSTGSQAARMALYPNPAVSGSNIALQLTGLQKGTYKLRVFNSTGQEVFAQQLVHTGGSVTQSLQLPSSLRTGIYNVQLSGTDVKWNKALVIE